MHLLAKVLTYPLIIAEIKHPGSMYALHSASVTMLLLTVKVLCNWSIP